MADDGWGKVSKLTVELGESKLTTPWWNVTKLHKTVNDM